MLNSITMDVIHVLVADACPLMRYGQRSLLGSQGDIRVIGEAEDYASLLRLCQEQRPDVVVLNDTPPTDCPNPLTVAVRDTCLSSRVVMLATDADQTRLRDLVTAGASGILLKSEPAELLPQAIRTVATGNLWLSRGVIAALVTGPRGEAEPAEAGAFNEREAVLLRLMAEGRSNAAIAAEMGLAGQTVRNYATRLYTKLGVRSRAEAIVWARERGFYR